VVEMTGKRKGWVDLELLLEKSALTSKEYTALLNLPPGAIKLKEQVLPSM